MATEYLAALTQEERIQLLVAHPVDLSSPEAAATVLAEATGSAGSQRFRVLWLAKGTVEGLSSFGALLAGRETHPLLMADLDHGTGSIVPGGTILPSVGSLLGTGFPADELQRIGAVLGQEAAALGITVGFVSAPPLSDLPQPLFVGGIGLGERTSRLVEAAAAEGLSLGVRLLDGKDSLAAPTTWDRARFEAVELAMVSSSRNATAPVVMLGARAAPSLSGDLRPAALSPALAQGLIRRDLGWEGLIIADLRVLPVSSGEATAAVEALLAGADLVIASTHADTVLEHIRAAVASGAIPAARVEEAARRVILATLRLGNRVPAAADSVRARVAAAKGVEIERTAAAHDRRLREATAATASGVWSDFSEVSPADAGMNAPRLQAADRAIQTAIRDSVFSAAALVVGRGGQLVRMRGYGRVSPGEAAVDPLSTIFDIASLTKVVGTTTAAALLVDRGMLELDAPVGRYLEEFSGDGRDDVTIRHLLTHSSGLPAGKWLFGSADSPGEGWDDALREPLVREPGERVEYSDLGMILLAEVIGRAADMPLDAFLATHLFLPLGMASTMFIPPLAFHDRIVPTTAEETERPYPLRGVVHDANAFRLAGVAGHAGIFSTARDLAVFSQMMLEGGSYGGVRILKEETVRAFTTPQRGAEERALGWDTPAEASSAGRFASSSTFGHTGYTGTSIWIDPAYDIFIVLLTNRTFTEGSAAEILRLRRTVHEAIYQAITDTRPRRRPGAR